MEGDCQWDRDSSEGAAFTCLADAVTEQARPHFTEFFFCADFPGEDWRLGSGRFAVLCSPKVKQKYFRNTGASLNEGLTLGEQF